MKTGLTLNAVLLILALAAWGDEASAEVLTVGQSPARFQSVQAAISAAQPGDTIQVQPGTYVGQLVLDRQLSLEGIGKPILRGAGHGSVVVVTADHCTVRGFVIEHCGNSLQDEDSGLLLKSGDNLVEDNELRDVLYGIYLYHAPRNTIRRNAIRGRRELEAGERGAGLHLWNSADNLLEENTITEARDGMYIQTSPGNTVRRNRVSRLRYGLHYMNSDDNRFEENVFSDNVAGAAIMYSRRIELRRNAFTHNRGFSSFGVLFQDCDEITAEDNYIIDNATGIFMEALRKSCFRRNVIAQNDLALQIYGSSDRNLFAGNNFIENLSPLYLVGKGSTTKWQENGRGNYWGDYDGYDLDGDGIGDVAHKVQNVFEYLEGNYPRLRLYLSSAAAQSLATAERTFPIFKGSSETDTAPLVKAAAINVPPVQATPQRRSQALLGLISMTMFGAGAVTIWRGQRR
ncbi:MAG TPA: nitrous oxide reductase family maturation protein NosD [Blastocatellia bacterium]|nr:nitrous oxide reductase family maturation protein NosD [Blastocatellia bacterium]